MSDAVMIPDEIQKKIDAGIKLDLELGCGPRKRHPEAVGIDMLEYAGVDIVGDIVSVLRSFPDGSIANVYSYHCLEHLPDLGAVVEQLGRIMVASARLKIVVPHFANPYYYSDSTHRQPFGLYTFSYYASDNIFSRRTPTYQRALDFEIVSVKLVFKAPPPFYIRWLFKKMVQHVVNLCVYFKELYEENFCWIVPCYEIEYEMVRK